MRLRLGLLLVTAFMLLSAEFSFDEGELECEEAVKHLTDCCGDVPAVRNITCYAERGCGNASPELDPGLAVCLRDASCDDVIAAHACNDPVTATCGR